MIPGKVKSAKFLVYFLFQPILERFFIFKLCGCFNYRGWLLHYTENSAWLEKYLEVMSQEVKWTKFGPFSIFFCYSRKLLSFGPFDIPFTLEAFYPFNVLSILSWWCCRRALCFCTIFHSSSRYSCRGCLDCVTCQDYQCSFFCVNCYNISTSIVLRTFLVEIGRKDRFSG